MIFGQFAQCKSMENNSRPERITMKTIWHSVLDVFDLEHGLIYTTIALTLRPGEALRTYLKEDRTRLVPPLRFLVFAVAIAAFITVQYMKNSAFLEQMRTGFEYGYRSGGGDGEVDMELMNKYFLLLNEFFANYFNVLLLVGVPILALCTFWLFRKNYNYAEHLVINSYVTAYQSILYVVMTPMLLFTDFNTLSLIYTMLLIVYSAYAYIKIFQQKIIIGTLKALLVTMLYFILYYILFIISFLTIVGIS